MRLLVCNDLDDWIVRKKDIRAWSHRFLWTLQDGDAIVSMSEMDHGHVRYVCALKGIDYDSLHFFPLRSSRFGGLMFDHLALKDEDFIAAVAEDIDNLKSVHALWPSPHINDFVKALGVQHLWDGAEFFGQGACEVINSMGSFRAFAAAAGVPTNEGQVVRSIEDAVAASKILFKTNPSIMVKKAHGGAGAGNHIVTLSDADTFGHAGGLYLSVLDDADAALKAFWDERWEWASSSGAYPVVVEAFRQDCRSFYAEFFCDDNGVEGGVIGQLIFEDRGLAREVVPTGALDAAAADKLAAGGKKLARYFQSLGYRGPLSADSIVDNTGEVTFTEVNAQYTGSTHLYEGIARLPKTLPSPPRQVSQLASKEEWRVYSTNTFVKEIESAGLAYDPSTGEGIVAVTPKIGEDGDEAPIIYAVLHQGEASFRQQNDALARIFAPRNRAEDIADTVLPYPGAIARVDDPFPVGKEQVALAGGCLLLDDGA